MLDGSLINEIQICEGLPLLLVDLKINEGPWYWQYTLLQVSKLQNF